MKIIKKILFIFIIQAFLITNTCFANCDFISNNKSPAEKTNLSPELAIYNSVFQGYYADLFKKKSNDISAEQARQSLIRDMYRVLHNVPIDMLGNPITNISELKQYLEKGHYAWQSASEERRTKLLNILEVLQKYLPDFLKRYYPGVNIESISIGGSMVEFWGSYPMDERFPYGDDLDVYLVVDGIHPGEQDISLNKFWEGQMINEELSDLGIYGVETMDVWMVSKQRLAEPNLMFQALYGSGLTIWGRPLSITLGFIAPIPIIARVETLLKENQWQKTGRLTVAYWLLKGLAEMLSLPFETFEKNINDHKEEALPVIKRNLERIMVFLSNEKRAWQQEKRNFSIPLDYEQWLKELEAEEASKKSSTTQKTVIVKGAEDSLYAGDQSILKMFEQIEDGSEVHIAAPGGGGDSLGSILFILELKEILRQQGKKDISFKIIFPNIKYAKENPFAGDLDTSFINGIEPIEISGIKNPHFYKIDKNLGVKIPVLDKSGSQIVLDSTPVFYQTLWSEGKIIDLLKEDGIELVMMDVSQKAGVLKRQYELMKQGRKVVSLFCDLGGDCLARVPEKLENNKQLEATIASPVSDLTGLVIFDAPVIIQAFGGDGELLGRAQRLYMKELTEKGQLGGIFDDLKFLKKHPDILERMKVYKKLIRSEVSTNLLTRLEKAVNENWDSLIEENGPWNYAALIEQDKRLDPGFIRYERRRERLSGYYLSTLMIKSTKDIRDNVITKEVLNEDMTWKERQSVFESLNYPYEGLPRITYRSQIKQLSRTFLELLTADKCTLESMKELFFSKDISVVLKLAVARAIFMHANYIPGQDSIAKQIGEELHKMMNNPEIDVFLIAEAAKTIGIVAYEEAIETLRDFRENPKKYGKWTDLPLYFDIYLQKRLNDTAERSIRILIEKILEQKEQGKAWELFLKVNGTHEAFQELKEKILKETRQKAENLKGGYKKLGSLISVITKTKKKPVLVYIDGRISSGKTTFEDLIKKKGISGVSASRITFLSLDDIHNDLYEQEHDPLTTALEIPIVLTEKIERAKDNEIIIIEGRETGSYLKEAGYEPDIAVIIEASEKVTLKRHMMRYGLLGIKFWFEDRLPAYIPKDTLVLRIKNEQDIPFVKFFSQTLLKTLTTTIRYVMPDKIADLCKDAVYWAKHQVKSALIEKVKTVRGAVNIVNIILFPLWLLSFTVNKLVDFYFLFHPSRDMVSIIKTRFGRRHIEVLDVGTGDGAFVERFQYLLNKKDIRAKVTGIDIRADGVSLGMSLKRNLRCLDVKDLYAHYAKTKFDLVIVNASPTPELAVREAMKVLKPDGLLVLRMVKFYQSKEDKEHVVKRLQDEYKVTVLKKSLHNLPAGAYYKLQKPVLVEHKNSFSNDNNPKHSSGPNNNPANVHDLQEFRERVKVDIHRLIDKGKLLEAMEKLKQLKTRNMDLSEEESRLIFNLRQRADYLFLSEEYTQALKFYQKILEISPKESSAYFYMGGIHIIESDFNLALVDFDKAKQGDRRSPIFNLAGFMAEAIVLSQEITQLAQSNDSEIKYNSDTLKMEKLKRYGELMLYIRYILTEWSDSIENFAQRGGIDSIVFYHLFEDFVEKLGKFERISRKIQYFLNGEKIPSFFDAQESIRKLKALRQKSDKTFSPNEEFEKDSKRIKSLLRFPHPGVPKIISQAI